MLIQPGCYPDPRNDHAFRRVFGDPRRAHVLRHLLNSVLRLRGDEAIHHLRIADPRQTPKHPDLKDTVLDVDCWDQRDHEFIVEMQVADERDFDKRALFYTAKAYMRRLPKGGKYKDLRKVTLLSVLGFQFLESPSYFSTHFILDKETGEHRLRDFAFAFLELPKFTLAVDKLKHPREKWTSFFKHAGQTPVRRIPAALRAVPEIEEAFEVLEEIGRDDLQRRLFEKAEMDSMDRVAQLETSYDKGHKKGRREGREEGLAEGLELAAARMLKQGLDPKTVAKITGLSLERIESLSRK